MYRAVDEYPAEKEVSPIQRQLGELLQVIGALEKRTEELIIKLNPVIANYPKNTSDKLGNSTAPSMISSLGIELFKVTDRMHALDIKLSSIISNLEI